MIISFEGERNTRENIKVTQEERARKEIHRVNVGEG
jgi:hypothetical protein